MFGFFPAGLGIHACHLIRALPTCMLLLFSWLSPLFACHSLHTPHLTHFCTAIVFLTCLLLAATFLLNTHFMHLVHSPFAIFFACYFMHAFNVIHASSPTFLLIFYMLFCGSLPNSATIHMAPLCEHFMARGIFCASA